MSDYIQNPIVNKDWDPTKGDYYSQKVMEEDKLYIRRKRRSKILVSFLAIAHILLLILIFLYY
ncbi:MAG: hypothetical protein KDC88_07595 [Ignavibacteriae bacterium]|nr:hypothetical protein [Ignavibacteriota bacterium]MCB9206072.1 hypothetical protein [Ignavibacteriales bacterium]MCB9209346.1 hypothetical protein [Ignavibacteriales bacterium]